VGSGEGHLSTGYSFTRKLAGLLADQRPRVIGVATAMRPALVLRDLPRWAKIGGSEWMWATGGKA
jgi:hypothetical protein